MSVRLLSMCGVWSGLCLGTATAVSAQAPQRVACPTIEAQQSPTASRPIFFVTTRETKCASGTVVLGSRRSPEPHYGSAADSRGRRRLAVATWKEWWTAVDLAIRSTPARRALLYVHGYNNSTNQALDRAQAVAAATRFDGPVVVFLWPSQSNLIQYTFDETNADWSAAYFRWLLGVITAGSRSVSVVSHSMGNRISWDGVRDLALRSPMLAARIDHFVLASPDVDRGALPRSGVRFCAVARGDHLRFGR
jgi:esterase/lipase superfamily enzyme